MAVTQFLGMSVVGEWDGVRCFSQKGPTLLRPFRGVALNLQVLVSAGPSSRISVDMGTVGLYYTHTTEA